MCVALAEYENVCVHVVVCVYHCACVCVCMYVCVHVYNLCHNAKHLHCGNPCRSTMSMI